MIAALLTILKAMQRVWLLEVVAAGLVVAGCAVKWGTGVALLAAGGCAALKAFDLSLSEP